VFADEASVCLSPMWVLNAKNHYLPFSCQVCFCWAAHCSIQTESQRTMETCGIDVAYRSSPCAQNSIWKFPKWIWWSHYKAQPYAVFYGKLQLVPTS
jgi:hypothetical protein